MRTRPLKNVAASVRDRLLARSRETGEDFQFLLWRYVVERFLFRLSHSPYRDHFVLKGAMLFAVWNESLHRQTRDIDFAAYGDSETDDLVTALQQVCRTGVDDDGVVFHADQISSSTIRGTTDQGGTRFRFPATVGRARITVQVDIGVGDSIQPPPADAEFPTLLGTAKYRVRAYPKEAVVSEKFHATVVHGAQTSRYKDFFDLYELARCFRFDGVRLVQALAATFQNRSSPTDDVPLSLTRGFYTDLARGDRWRAYLTKRGRLSAPMDFGAIGELVILFLAPPWRALAHGDRFVATWPGGGPWHSKIRARTGS